jgi:dolichol kinase
LLTEGSRQRSGSPGHTQPGAPAPSPPSRARGGLKGHVWGTDDRNYRECSDDGAVTGLLFGPLVSGSLLLTTLRQRKQSAIAFALPNNWLVEAPLVLPSSTPAADRAIAALEALTKSRRSMLSLSTVVTLVLLLQLLLSRRAEMALVFKQEGAPSAAVAVPSAKHPKGHHSRGKEAERDKERERWWVPRNEWTRTVRVVGLAFAATTVLGSLKAVFGYWNSPLWRGASRLAPV